MANTEYEVGNSQLGKDYLDRLLEVVQLTPPGPTMGYVFLSVLPPTVARITGEFDKLEAASAASAAVLSSPDARPYLATTAHLGLALQVVLRRDPVQAHQEYEILRHHQEKFLYKAGSRRTVYWGCFPPALEIPNRLFCISQQPIPFVLIVG